MAALYLHQALFADDAQPPSSSHRPPRLHQGRQLSSISSVTLNSASENSHAPLVDSYPDSSAYFDLLTRRAPHANEGFAATELSLNGDPITERERRRHWEKVVRRRLRRLKWSRHVLRVVIGAWAVYTTARYFLAFTTYTSHDRQVTLLVLGSVSVLSLAFILVSQVLGLFAPHLGWNYSARAPYNRVQVFLNYASSLLLLCPAVVNLVLVFVWRRSSDQALSLEGRCRWDIDVVWSGAGFECDDHNSVRWGSWLAGAVVRLLLTALFLMVYHYISHTYSVTRRPSRRRTGRPHSHSRSSTGRTSRHVSSIQSSRTMTSVATTPVSLAGNGRLPSMPTSGSDITRETTSVVGSSEKPVLRRSSSRIAPDGQILAEDRSRHSHISFSRSGPSSTGHSSHDEPDPDSLTDSDDENVRDSYGRPIRQPFSGYAVIPPSILASHHRPQPPHTPDDDFSAFVADVTRETEHGMHLAQNDRPGFYDPVSGSSQPYERFSAAASDDDNDNDTDYVPVVGRLIQRMPTIESLGSREVTSLSSMQRGDRSVHTLSRPPTRATTLRSETVGSQPPSRSNSLTASIMLSASAAEGGPVGTSELGALSDSPHGSGGSSYLGGTKSTMSYHTAVGSVSSVESAHPP